MEQRVPKPMSNVVESQTEVEEYDLAEAAPDGDLAVAERLLAGLLVRSWMARRQACSGAGEEVGQVEPGDL
jgi:hypothetical protein